MPTKRKLEKRKKREKIGRERAKQARSELIKKKAAENADRKRLKRLEKLQRDMLAMDQPADSDKLLQLDDKAITMLEKNIEILKGLEKEFEEEQARRNELNEELEEQGHVTLEDKLKAVSDETIRKQKAESLHQDLQTKQQIAAKKQEGAQVGVGGSADCSMSVNTDDEENDSGVIEDQVVS